MSVRKQTCPMWPSFQQLCEHLHSTVAYLLWQVGKKNRVTAATAMNQDSSRSHSVFTITVESSTGGGIDDATGVAQVKSFACSECTAG